MIATTTTNSTQLDASAKRDRSPVRVGHIPPCRNFTLLDAMVLVAATAVTFTLARPYVTKYGPVATPFVMVPPLAIAWTPAMLWLRLRRPRPTLSRLTRQPGMAACGASTFLIAVGALLLVICAVIRAWVAPGSTRFFPGSTREPWWTLPIYIFSGMVGPAVFGAWLHLALSGRRRPEPGWIDRLGRVLGGVWIALFFVLCGVLVYTFYR